MSNEVSCHRDGAKWERCRIKRFAKLPFARALPADLRPEDFARARSAASEGQVRHGAREMNLMSSVLETARRDGYWLRNNRVRGGRWPKTPNGPGGGVNTYNVQSPGGAPPSPRCQQTPI